MRAVLVRFEPVGDGKIRVLSPAVGWWERPPRAGEIVGPGSSVGTMRQLNQRFDLLLPEGVAGRIDGPPRQRRVPLAYVQPMFSVLPLGESSEILAAVAAGIDGRAGDTSVPAGHFAVTSPTDGVFYRRSAPDSPPFVEVGARIHDGQPVGLVEVMKTFNQILFGGPGLPAEADVVEVRCDDAEEVEAGQVLMVVR